MSSPRGLPAHVVSRQLRRAGFLIGYAESKFANTAAIRVRNYPPGATRVSYYSDNPSEVTKTLRDLHLALLRHGHHVDAHASRKGNGGSFIVTRGNGTPSLVDELRVHAPRGFRFTPNPELPAEPCGYCAMHGATVVLRVYGRPHADDPFGDAVLDGCRDCAPAILEHMHGANSTNHDLEAEYRP